MTGLNALIGIVSFFCNMCVSYKLFVYLKNTRNSSFDTIRLKKNETLLDLKKMPLFMQMGFVPLVRYVFSSKDNADRRILTYKIICGLSMLIFISNFILSLFF